MKVGDLVRSNVEFNIGIIVSIKRDLPDKRKRYRVMFPNLHPIWLTAVVLEVIQ